MSSENTAVGGYYFAPPSIWPLVGSIALLFLGAGTVMWMNQIQPWGGVSQIIGFAILLYGAIQALA